MKTPEPIAAKPRYEILDGLRGVAAALVVAFHLLESYCVGDHTRQIINHGYLAVDFFFVLSGFVIGYAYDDRWAKGLSVWQFFRRRLVRLHPMVVFGTAFGALLFYFQEAAFPSIAATSPWKMLAVMLLCFTMIPLGKSCDIRGWGETNPLNGPAWSLQWEYLANIAYALVLRRLKTWALALCVAAGGVMTVLLCLDIDLFGVLAARHGEAYTVIGGWSLTPDQLLIGITRLAYPFLAGLLLARVMGNVSRRGTEKTEAQRKNLRGSATSVALCETFRQFGFAVCSLIVAVTLAMPYFAPASAPWVNGLYEAVCILAVFPLVVALGAGAADGEGRACRVLGELSFPVYIVHYPLVYTQMAWVKTHPDAPAAQHFAVGASAFILAFAVAWAALKLYDIPVRQWLADRRPAAPKPENAPPQRLRPVRGGGELRQW